MGGRLQSQWSTFPSPLTGAGLGGGGGGGDGVANHPL